MRCVMSPLAGVLMVGMTIGIFGCGDNGEGIGEYGREDDAQSDVEYFDPDPGRSMARDADRAVESMPQVATPPAPAQQATDHADDPTVAAFLGLRGPKPETWSSQPPPNSMVNASYRVPGADGGDDAEINVFFFGAGTGGSVHDNVVRWQRQFRAPDGGTVQPTVEEFEVDTMPVTFVELAGEYMGMGQGASAPDQLFLAAIIDAPAGRLFIRFVGDRATVEANREDFMRLLNGLERATSG